MSDYSFDAARFFLGSLCPHGHDYENTEQSLRYIKGNRCTVCNSISREKYRQSDKWNETCKNYQSRPDVRERRNQQAKSSRKRFQLLYPGEVYFLGKLCPKNHNHESTVQSLRYVSKGTCVQCHKEAEQQLYYKDAEKTRQRNRERMNARHAANPEHCNRISRLSKRRCFEKMTPEQKEQYRLNSKAYSRQYYLDNREAIREAQRIVYASNPELQKSIKLRAKVWSKTEKGRASRLVRKNRRRTQVQNSHHFSYTSEQIQQLKSFFNESCAYCGSTDKLTLDHFIPISKGGPDVLSNLLPACNLCNASKCDRDGKSWYENHPTYSSKRWKRIVFWIGSDLLNGQLPLF